MRHAVIRGLGLVLIGFGALSGCTPEGGSNVAQSHSTTPARPELPPLDLGNSATVLDQLDALERLGGTQAVAQWAERELPPGRRVTYTGRRGGTAETVVLADRSVWRLQPDGRPSPDAILAPLTDEAYGESEVFAVWSRPQADEPFALRLRALVNARP